MTNKQETKKFRFIPYRKHDILEIILQQGKLSGQEKDFRQLYRMLSSVLHFEFHEIIESLKDSYACIDPDADTGEYKQAAPLTGLNLVELLGEVLNKANYECITEADLNQAMNIILII
ncbi:MAG: hypothetical protein OEY29_03975 [Gammaproteobacteria bacterium]|nr:hypothetical protein [Gammaproteobacteria bacterium]